MSAPELLCTASEETTLSVFPICLCASKFPYSYPTSFSGLTIAESACMFVPERVLGYISFLPVLLVEPS